MHGTQSSPAFSGRTNTDATLRTTAVEEWHGQRLNRAAMKFPCLLTLSLLLLLSATGGATIDFGRPVSKTPYDAYIVSPVQDVLQRSDAQSPSMEEVRTLLKTARGFRYEMREPFVPAAPAVTGQRQAGDCKDKSLWLCQQLGDRSVRFVVGKAKSTSAMSHAWLLWKKDGTWWILDPAHSWEPIPADSVGTSTYLPRYSYTRSGRYAHDGSSRSGLPSSIASR
jgi:hypothetical protein